MRAALTVRVSVALLASPLDLQNRALVVMLAWTQASRGQRKLQGASARDVKRLPHALAQLKLRALVDSAPMSCPSHRLARSRSGATERRPARRHIEIEIRSASQPPCLHPTESGRSYKASWVAVGLVAIRNSLLIAHAQRLRRDRLRSNHRLHRHPKLHRTTLCVSGPRNHGRGAHFERS